MAMMRVAFCTRDYANVSGGHNTWLCRFVPDLRRRGVQVKVLVFNQSPNLPTARSLLESGVICAPVGETELRYTEQRVRWILEQLTDYEPDVFVVNAVYPAAYFAARWLREAGIPTVGVCHLGPTTELCQGLLDEFVFGRDVYRVSALVCVSRWLEQAVLPRCPETIVVCIPCGVSIPETVAKKPDAWLRLAYVGRLAAEKRIVEVARTLCRATHEVPGTSALIYGDGPLRASVEQVLNVGNGFVKLVGYVGHHEIQKRLLGCHAVVLLSDQEGLGLSLLEGMACGVVPIGLRGAPGVTEFVSDNVTGLLVDDRGDAFVAAVRRLRNDMALWERLARAARVKVETDYCEDLCAGRWQALFHKLASDSGPRQPIRIPRRLELPPVHPSLDWLDHRRFRELARRFVPKPVRQLIHRIVP
jgi:colanic acid/amylovoran biosynthesis glycosyltransferase